MSSVQQIPPPHLTPEEEGDIDSQKAVTREVSEQNQPLPLPAPPSTQGGETASLDVSGTKDEANTVKFEHLGPMVLNSDGTLSRIHNWSQMTESERERTLKILGKRNQLRMDKLKAEEKESAE